LEKFGHGLHIHLRDHDLVQTLNIRLASKLSMLHVGVWKYNGYNGSLTMAST
jgi:hypothetical protein